MRRFGRALVVWTGERRAAALLVILLLRAASPDAATCEPLSSASLISYDTGSAPSSVANVGLDADGKPDMAVATATFDHLWSHAYGGANDFGYSLAVDGSGNVAITGSLYGPADFGGGTLPTGGGGDLFLVKLDAGGNHLWSKSFGDGNIQNGLDVAFDPDGNVIVTGYLFGSADFGGATLTSAGADDILLVKFDPDGHHLWSKRFGGANSFPNFQKGESVAIDGAGNIFVSGSLGGPVDFGGGTLFGSGFLAKFDPAGNHLWSRGFGGEIFRPRLAVDADGNVVMSAEFRGSASFGGVVLTSNRNSLDIVVAKFAPGSSHLLSRLFGDASSDEPLDVATDSDGNILLAGLFSGTIDFGGSPIIGTFGDDLFLAKLGPNGNHIWSQRFVGSGSLFAVEEWITLGTDGRGNIVLAGAFDGTRDFGGEPLVEAGNIDVFVAEFAPDGAHLASRRLGNTDFQWNDASAVDPNGDIVIMGQFNFTIDFGGGPLTASDFRAIYVAKLTGVAPNCVEAGFDMTPNTLNLRSLGRWVAGVIEPEPPGLPEDIDVGSIRLNGSVPVDASGPTSIGDADLDGRPDLTVKFDRAAVELAVNEGEAVPVTVTGKIGIGCFEGSDTIRVIRGHVTAPVAGAVLAGGSTTDVRWDTPSETSIQSVAVLSSVDDGATWNLEAHNLSNTGSYAWAVPAAGTDRARIAVVLVESADPSGYEVTGVVGVSGRFAVTAALGVGDERLSLALHGAVPNPSRGLNVSFSLANSEPARLTVYDVSGREVSARQVGSFGPGRHVVSFGAARRFAPGVYLVHLVQGGRKLVARAVVVQ